MGWGRGPPDLQRQQGRLPEADGGPGQRGRGRRACKQESQTRICRANTCASKEKVRGKGAAADLAAPTGPAACAAMALRSAASTTERARIRAWIPTKPRIRKPRSQRRKSDTRRHARRQPRRQRRSVGTAQRRPVRPLGPLVKLKRTTVPTT